MHIIILANHQSSGLSPLTDDSSTALLEVGGKPLIEHLLDNIAGVPHKRVTIVASRAFDVLVKHIATGTRWGLDIEFIASRPNETLSTLRRRHSGINENGSLVLSADRLYTRSLAEHHSVGQWQSDSMKSACAHVLEPAIEVSTHQQYLDLCLSAARGEIHVINVRGSERTKGLRCGYQCRISTNSIVNGMTLAGNHCQVDKSSRLEGTVVLESSVVVDRNTRIEDSVIVAHTYIGEQLNLKRCIVSGRYLVRVDDGVVVELTDSFMAAPLRKGLYAAHLAGPTNQLLGVIAGVAALPLMPVGVVASLWENPYEPFVKKTWVSNLPPGPGSKYRTYDSFEFNVSNQALRKLPQILDIGLGHLRWFGVSVASQEELASRKEPWQMTRDKHPMGMLGVAQIDPEKHADPTKRFLKDAMYVSNTSISVNLSILKKGMVILFKLKTVQSASAQIVE